MQHSLAASLVTLVLVCPFIAGSGSAAPITYTETTTASGSLDGVAFTDSLVTVSLVGDMSDVVSPEPGIFFSPGGVASLTVAGLGTATFAGNATALLNQDPATGGAGIGLASTGQGEPPLILGTVSPVLTTYDLTSAIGPVTGLSRIDAGADLQTSSGIFVLTSAGDATFTASTAAATVPEPISLALMSVGLLGSGLARRRGAKTLATAKPGATMLHWSGCWYTDRERVEAALRACG